jgi:predicted dehydrogenase
MKRNSSRREFIRLTAATAAGALIIPSIIPSTAMGMGGKVAPSDRIVMGAVGVGSQGTGNMRRFLKIKQVQVVALCDVDTSHLAKAKDIVDIAYNNKDCRVYGDYREFLEKEKIDAVSIALPDHWHGIIYSAAANKKLDVYGEKPICRTIQDGKTIVNSVKRNNIISIMLPNL